MVSPGVPAFAQSAPVATAAPAKDWVVKPQWIAAHERFLAGPELRGRGSATHDEAVAAAYVASQFEGYGLHHAPGMDRYVQQAKIVRLGLDGAAQLGVAGKPVDGAALLIGDGREATGTLAVFSGDDLAALPDTDIIAIDSDNISAFDAYRAASAKGARLVIVKADEQTKRLSERFGGRARMPSYLEGAEPEQATSLVTVPAEAMKALAAAGGQAVAFSLPGLVRDTKVTTNAVGYLPGSDPQAGVILFSAHLDHLGMRPDGTMMPGANDDASGTTAVLELAHALAAGKQHRRGILFVAYGSEEIGGFGSKYFGAHPPVPLDDIIANIEVEMIGAQDPKLPDGTMMMTGFGRSNLGPALAAHGALVTKDPYPEQHFFQRSDNYSLALKGVVAHTISGWAVVPTYHSPKDTIGNLDIGFMAKAIQSLIGPARWLADSDFEPEWNPGGRPKE
ncbi:M28 family peptidase [Sphingomonadaceae bacterium LXI357]|uniref:M28 family peptidase n=2 Tax=Stakelama marina TaxID=2826939 RepID=A0A8T4ILT6_9SPHN|nr:M28 family peptidase [Stakelama marina]